ncbi:MAG: hypothetical protein ACK2VA_07265 [Anaerolineae bacterium]
MTGGGRPPADTDAGVPHRELRSRILTLLTGWAAHAEQYWYEMPDAPGFGARMQGQLGCYGTGYNAWGVQTNQKYVSAMAVLGTLGGKTGLVPADVCSLARDRALAALRFSLHSHVSGKNACTDGTQWGHTWISALGIERMMHGVYLLDPYLDAVDGNPNAGEDLRAALQRVLCSEADWILESYHRGTHRGVVGSVWNRTGRNAPESNLWNGAILWRASVMYPDHPHAAAWQQEAHHFLMNAVSVPADAAEKMAGDDLLIGKSVREWHAGANFFPSYALDHHGYLNVGYMFICLSNAAMLHFDMKRLGLPAPASLYHHQADLWRVSRRLLFSDGRLARVGGDSRVRYAYCQEYALPSLLFAADALDEPFAGALLAAQLDWIEQEAAYNVRANSNSPDPAHRGSFYGRRLQALAERSPYYYTRLESDRACALGMTLAFLEQLASGDAVTDREPDTEGRPEEKLGPVPGLEARQAFELSVAGTWCEPAHGAVVHRCPSRLASFSWRAHGLGQGMCQPPDDGHLAEWLYNLAGVARFQGEGEIEGGQTRHRRLLRHEVHCFDGGFATWGAIAEGVDLQIAEGWHGDMSATHQIAFVALPDARTVVGLQFCRTACHRTYACEVKGLHLNLPNDLFNGFRRELQTESGAVMLQAPATEAQCLDLASPWACVAENPDAGREDRLGVVRLYGDESLTVHRVPGRRGGKFGSLYTEQICLGCSTGVRALDPETVVLDCGWAVLSSAGPKQTRRCARESTLLDLPGALVRGVRVQGADRWYAVVANWGSDGASFSAGALLGDVTSGSAVGYDTLRREELSGQDEFVLLPGQVGVVALASR